MTDLNIKQIQVSGPLNVVRLEGRVHDMDKVIYLFMDIHEDVSRQTECTNIFSKDINRYLAESFYALNDAPHKYDFFMEIRPTETLARFYDDTFKRNKNKYIYQMMKLFTTVFRYDKKKNQVKISDLFKNVRFHYLDIRDYLHFHIFDLVEEAYHLSNQFMYNIEIDPTNLDRIIEDLTIAKSQLELTLDILTDTAKAGRKETVIKEYEGANLRIIRQFSLKIRKAYKHPDVQRVLVKQFDNTLKRLDRLTVYMQQSIDKMDTYYNKIIGAGDKLTSRNGDYGLSNNEIRQIINNIIGFCEHINNELIIGFARVTDIYLLRRFLDKDYVTNAIVFTGALHSENYMRILVTYFGFRISHMAHSHFESFRQLERQIKARENADERIADLVFPLELQQCSDITHFPKNFE